MTAYSGTAAQVLSSPFDDPLVEPLAPTVDEKTKGILNLLQNLNCTEYHSLVTNL